MNSSNLTVLIYSAKRVISLTDKRLSLEIEIPQGAGRTMAKMTFADLDNINSKIFSHVEINDLEQFVSRAKYHFEVGVSDFYPLNAPNGGEFRIDKNEFEFLELVLNEPDDECLDNMLMAKNPIDTFTPDESKD